MKIPRHFFFIALGSWGKISDRGLFLNHNSTQYQKLNLYEKALIRNGELTVILNHGEINNHHPPYTVLNDAGCANAVHAYDSHNHIGIAYVYANTADLRYKSDICRLVILEKNGGFYSDLDQKPVHGFVDLVPKNATMVAVMTDEHTERFTRRVIVGINTLGLRLANGFLGFMPRHPFILRCLEEFVLEYRANPSFSSGLGPHLMTRMINMNQASIKQQPVYVFVESLNVKGDPNHQKVPMQDGGNDCNYIMFDQKTKRVIFYTRVKVSGFRC